MKQFEDSTCWDRLAGKRANSRRDLIGFVKDASQPCYKRRTTLMSEQPGPIRGLSVLSLCYEFKGKLLGADPDWRSHRMGGPVCSG